MHERRKGNGGDDQLCLSRRIPEFHLRHFRTPAKDTGRKIQMCKVLIELLISSRKVIPTFYVNGKRYFLHQSYNGVKSAKEEIETERKPAQ